MNDRTYIPSMGFQIEGQTFAQHKIGCAQCERFDEDKPATLAFLCLDGSVLWKKDNAVAIERDPRPVSEYRTTTKEAKKLTRYK